MILELNYDDDSEPNDVYFGVNDIHVADSGTLEFWLHHTVESENTGRQEKNANINMVLEEGHKIDVDIIEILIDYTAYEDTNVFIGISESAFNETIRAVNDLLRDDESDVTPSDFTFIGDTTSIHM